MRQDSAAWERAAEVREAAQGWLRVGAIDEPTEHAIREAFPDPSITPSAVWRVLTACVVVAVIAFTFEAFSIAFRPSEIGHQVLLFLFAGASLASADLLEASPRFARRGAAGAASFLGTGFLLAGFGLFLVDTLKMRFDDALDAALVASFLAWAAGCRRWGSPLFAALSAVSLFLFLGRQPYGRVLWVLVGAALAGVAARRLDEASWAPSHRRAAAVLVVAGVVAAYAAVNVYSLDRHLLEDLGRFAARRIVASRGLIVLSALATAAVPLAVLAWGARSRRTFLLDTGIVLQSPEQHWAGIQEEGTGHGTGNGDRFSGGARSSPLAPGGAGHALAGVIEAVREAARVGKALAQARFRWAGSSDSPPRDGGGQSTQDRVARTSMRRSSLRV